MAIVKRCALPLQLCLSRPHGTLWHKCLLLIRPHTLCYLQSIFDSVNIFEYTCTAHIEYTLGHEIGNRFCKSKRQHIQNKCLMLEREYTLNNYS